MAERLKLLVQAIRETLGHSLAGQGSNIARFAVVGAVGYVLYTHPPLRSVERGEIGIRHNMLTGGSTEVHEGSVVVIPGLQQLRRFSLRDQLYRPDDSSKANGPAPFQSMEGLSVGVELTIRYALDPTQVANMASNLPDDIGTEIVKPEVQGVIYKILTRYSVREIFSTKRGEIQQAIEAELKPRLAADGIRLHGVQMGNVDLPADYRAGMEKLLAEELETEKMRYTLELKDKQVKERGLEADAEKIAREKAAEAAGNEQIIAAKAQEEAMKHVLPFKQKQIEQRQLEAEADKISRVKAAEGNAQARVIEATGEADSRRKLADVEVYRMEKVGKVSSEQMARDGELLSQHPLLIQKTLADKLSDKISVIIAPPSVSGGFIGSGLLGSDNKTAGTVAATSQSNAAADASAGEAQ